MAPSKSSRSKAVHTPLKPQSTKGAARRRLDLPPVGRPCTSQSGPIETGTGRPLETSAGSSSDCQTSMISCP
jgi:hypothetical protein